MEVGGSGKFCGCFIDASELVTPNLQMSVSVGGDVAKDALCLSIIVASTRFWTCIHSRVLSVPKINIIKIYHELIQPAG